MFKRIPARTPVPASQQAFEDLPIFNVRPFSSRVLARVLKRDLVDVAVETVDIAPETRWEADPVIALPHESDRIVRHHHFSNPAENIANLTSRVVVQGATKMFRVKDVIVADGAVFASSAYRLLEKRRKNWVLRGIPRLEEPAALCSSYQTENFFGHWLTDGLPHELLARDQSLAPVTIKGPVRLHESGYRELTRLPVECRDYFRANSLWLLEDWGHNHHRVERMARLRRRMLERVEPDECPYVFISRGSTGKGRNMVNEGEVREALVALGFVVVEPENSSTQDVVRALAGARMIVSVEGSACDHAIMAAPASAGLLTIMCPHHFNLHFRPLTAARQMRLAYVIGNPIDTANFVQPIDRLLRTIDLLEVGLG